jgi:enolase
MAGIRAAGYVPGDQVAIALDPATSSFYKDGAYVLEHEGTARSAPRR